MNAKTLLWQNDIEVSVEMKLESLVYKILVTTIIPFVKLD